MSILAKSLLATAFLGAGVLAVLSMLALMGRTESRLSPGTLRRLHKGFGALFAVLLLMISYFCAKYVKMAGEYLSARAVFHGVLALALLVVLALKVAIVQFYKEFIRFVPSMGMTVFALAFLVYFTSAGYFFLGAGLSQPPMPSEQPSVASLVGDAESGRVLFENNCSFCHYADREEAKIGPGLRGVLRQEELPFSGRPATPENVRQQLMNPVADMPSFRSTLSEQQVEHLLAFLRTL